MSDRWLKLDDDHARVLEAILYEPLSLTVSDGVRRMDILRMLQRPGPDPVAAVAKERDELRAQRDEAMELIDATRFFDVRILLPEST